MVHICTANHGPTGVAKLADFRCYCPVWDAKTELSLIEKAQNGDNRAGWTLVSRFHSQILRLAGKHVPSGSVSFTRRSQRSTQLFDDLVAQGHLALWQTVLKFDLKCGYRLWTFAGKKVGGAISDAAKEWRKGGISGETRVDRWLLHNANATPARLFAASKRFGLKKQVFASLQDAGEYIQEFETRYRREVYSSVPEWNGKETADERYVAPCRMRDLYSCFDPHSWSPQLRTHKKISRIIDDLIRESERPRRLKEPVRRTKPITVQPTGNVLPTTVKPSWCDDATWDSWVSRWNLKPETEQIWPDTQLMTLLKLSPSLHQPRLPVQSSLRPSGNLSACPMSAVGR